MKPFLLAAAFALILLAGLAAPVSASEPAVLSDAGFLSPAPAVRAGLCPTYYCPIYYPEIYCTCEWIECPNGQIVCGVWNGTAPALQKTTSAGAGRCTETVSGR